MDLDESTCGLARLLRERSARGAPRRDVRDERPEELAPPVAPRGLALALLGGAELREAQEVIAGQSAGGAVALHISDRELRGS